VIIFTFQQVSNVESLEGLSQLTQSGAEGGSSQRLKSFDGYKDVVAFLPLGFFTALFRPLPGDVLSPFGFLASFEGVFLLWLFLRTCKRSSFKDIKDPIIFWGISVIFAWASAYAFVSYKNLGTAMRWRLQILPLFLSLMLYLGRDRKKTMSTPVTEHDIPPSQIK
jgi:hypothetical protein